ncbi:11999_t:CDS:2 [Acaulospora morrowiae]|uniref:11999_t:CDS:1 n=1 Tax=Acaulospora morrowiae TaxID=94023 RepID=A0A9N8W3K8_9GLOM|nr:11999_t:CDS:2 [Acaulospora morrowiae]
MTYNLSYIIKESLLPEEKEMNEEVSIEKGNKTSNNTEEIQAEVLKELSHNEDEQIIKPVINFDISILKNDSVVLIKELLTPMETT